MEQDIAAHRPSNRTRLKMALLFVVLLALAAMIWGLADPSSSGNKKPAPGSANQTRSPDEVKSTTGPNGDTAPSSTGTGPGSNNSLLGPQP